MSKKDEQKAPIKKTLLRILMLHGYRQSESAFRERSGGLRKGLKNYADFVFCEAPHIIPNGEAQNETQEEKGWWFSKADKSYDAIEKTDCDLGFEQTLDYINKVFEEKGPFDGILGFSQGACLAAILCKLATSENERYKFIRFKFGIIIAGFMSGQVQHEIYYDNKINMPTLHVIGKTDKVIPFELSNKLTDFFTEPSVYVHEAGHFIPVNAESKAAFVAFLEKMR